MSFRQKNKQYAMRNNTTRRKKGCSTQQKSKEKVKFDISLHTDYEGYISPNGMDKKHRQYIRTKLKELSDTENIYEPLTICEHDNKSAKYGRGRGNKKRKVEEKEVTRYHILWNNVKNKEQKKVWLTEQEVYKLLYGYGKAIDEEGRLMIRYLWYPVRNHYLDHLIAMITSFPSIDDGLIDGETFKEESGINYDLSTMSRDLIIHIISRVSIRYNERVNTVTERTEEAIERCNELESKMVEMTKKMASMEHKLYCLRSGKSPRVYSSNPSGSSLQFSGPRVGKSPLLSSSSSNHDKQ